MTKFCFFFPHFVDNFFGKAIINTSYNSIERKISTIKQQQIENIIQLQIYNEIFYKIQKFLTQYFQLKGNKTTNKTIEKIFIYQIDNR